LTTSRIDRQNILNNEFALGEIRDKTEIRGVVWEGKLMFTRDMAASYFEVDVRTIGRCIERNKEELSENGYEVLRGERLRDFLATMAASDFAKDTNVLNKTPAEGMDIDVHTIATEEGKDTNVLSLSAGDGKDINVLTMAAPDFDMDIDVHIKTHRIEVFDFRAFLNLSMLLSGSEKAKALRQMMLDIVIDLINQRTGGSTKYINQRDKDYITASLQEDDYRSQFMAAMEEYVVEERGKCANVTDMIYVSIFKEKAMEYKAILDLKASENEKDTFYSEILDIIAAYEAGLADELKSAYGKKGCKLTVVEVDELFKRFEGLALWKPLIHRGRVKMASRDLALREAFHYQLSEYIRPLDQEEYDKFLGAAAEELERLMEENRYVLQRLKERE
jgi:hypothetical protein